MQKGFLVTIVSAVVLGLGYVYAPPGAAAEVLITPNEAMLPDSPDAATAGGVRGLTRGPTSEQILPDPRGKGIKSPFSLHIQFVAHNNTLVVPDSVRVIYLKLPSVDLTSRIKRHLTSKGIDISDTEVPVGTHVLRIEMQDSQGRAGVGIIKLSVIP